MKPAPATWAELGVVPPLVEALTERGLSAPFPIQALTIADALAGRDVSGKARTGSGKTLAFGIPLLQTIPKATPRTPTGLCLVPTRELATQVAEELEPLGRAVDRTVLAVYGGAPIEKQIKKLERGVDLVVATPGRVIDLIEREALTPAQVSVVVVDEADRMADMGFIDAVEWILRHIDGAHQTLLFSATLDGVVDGLISRHQRDPVRHEVASQSERVEKMIHRFLSVHEMDKSRVAAAIIRGNGRSMVFTNTKWAADKVAERLTKEGISALPIHGNLRQREREQALADFTEGRVEALVATDVAARGIHVDGVEVVIHWDAAPDHKTYLHRSGRTARAGEAGVAVTLALWNDELTVRQLQRRLGFEVPLVEVFSNDPRLADLYHWPDD